MSSNLQDKLDGKVFNCTDVRSFKASSSNEFSVFDDDSDSPVDYLDLSVDTLAIGGGKSFKSKLSL